jgi:hypothetical protein
LSVKNININERHFCRHYCLAGPMTTVPASFTCDQPTVIANGGCQQLIGKAATPFADGKTCALSFVSRTLFSVTCTRYSAPSEYSLGGKTALPRPVSDPGEPCFRYCEHVCSRSHAPSLVIDCSTGCVEVYITARAARGFSTCRSRGALVSVWI